MVWPERDRWPFPMWAGMPGASPRNQPLEGAMDAPASLLDGVHHTSTCCRRGHNPSWRVNLILRSVNVSHRGRCWGQAKRRQGRTRLERAACTRHGHGRRLPCEAAAQPQAAQWQRYCDRGASAKCRASAAQRARHARTLYFATSSGTTTSLAACNSKKTRFEPSERSIGAPPPARRRLKSCSGTRRCPSPHPVLARL